MARGELARRHCWLALSADLGYLARMTKKDVHQRLIEKLASELESISAAAKNTISTATNEAHRSESKYDTFSLESSYLARGQAKRVEELAYALDRLRSLPQKELGGASPIQHGALVRLESGDVAKRTLFFCPGGGGEQVTVEGEEVSIVTAQSPLGKAMLGKAAGATFDIQIGARAQTFRVVSVE